MLLKFVRPLLLLYRVLSLLLSTFLNGLNLLILLSLLALIVLRDLLLKTLLAGRTPLDTGTFPQTKLSVRVNISKFITVVATERMHIEVVVTLPVCPVNGRSLRAVRLMTVLTVAP